MYSARIFGEPTTFGTSGLLYRSNKLMYDRKTRSIWHQFTGEPVIGPLADSGIRLEFFPVLVTTWAEWVEEHPDTTVLSVSTGIYPASRYRPESDPLSVYYSYRNTADPMFPVWNRDDTLDLKESVLGLGIGDSYKAYPVFELQVARVVNDELGGTAVVIVASGVSQGARAYERGGHVFSLGDPSDDGLPSVLVDSDGGKWEVTEEYLVSSEDPDKKLERLPTHMAYWLGWSSFHPETELYAPDSD